jgi:hypothetical protein
MRESKRAPPSGLVERLMIFLVAKPGWIFYNSFMKTVTLVTNSLHRPLLRRALLLRPVTFHYKEEIEYLESE